ncbi:MAG: hypothetical protein ACE5H8_10450 [Alphaproteobacteria bacterium]
MKALATLIRLHKQRLDDARRRLNELEEARERLCEEQRRLAAELAAERRAAAESFEAGRTLAAYAERIAREQAALGDRIAEYEASIAQAAEVVAAAFRELKKYEISRDRRAEHDKRLEGRREQSRLDDIGITRFRRRKAT